MTAQTEAVSDNRLLRGQETRHALMRAAEKLIAEKGVEAVSIREIVAEAGQNNASALQYHFGSLRGLIDAILEERAAQTQAKRAVLMSALLDNSPEPDLRQLCTLIVQPAFELARSKPDFRRYIKAFGHHLVLLESSPASRLANNGAGGESGARLAKLLKQALPHLGGAAFKQRMDFAARLCVSAMYAEVGSKKAFQGESANFFINGLIDSLVGLLTAPVTQPEQTN